MGDPSPLAAFGGHQPKPPVAREVVKGDRVQPRSTLPRSLITAMAAGSRANGPCDITLARGARSSAQATGLGSGLKSEGAVKLATTAA